MNNHTNSIVEHEAYGELAIRLKNAINADNTKIQEKLYLVSTSWTFAGELLR